MSVLKQTATAFLFHDSRLLLVYHKKLQRWMHVGGHIEFGETPSQALVREVREEVNLDFSFLEWYPIMDILLIHRTVKQEPKPFLMHTRPTGESETLCYDFVCKVTDISQLQLAQSEITDYKWLTEQELRDDTTVSTYLRILALNAFSVYKAAL